MMYNVFSADCDSSSRCSTASPAADSYGCYPSPGSYTTSMGSPQSQDFTDLTVVSSGGVSSSSSSFVPTITAISSSPELQWMVQTVAPSPHRAHPYTASPSPSSAQYPRPAMKSQASKAHNTSGNNKRSRAEQVSSEEEEKRRVRRERNKQAAAKCRNRRRELTDTLQAETDDLEDEKSILQNDIANLLKEKERLEFILAAHQPICKIPADLDAVSPALSHCSVEMSPCASSAATCSPPAATVATAPIAASYSLFSSPAPVMSTAASATARKLTVLLDDATALEESLDLLATTEMEVARSVPEVELSSSLYAQDWEPLYTPAGINNNNNNNNSNSSSNNVNTSCSMDFEPLCTPVVTCTPSCTTFTSSFVFTYPEDDPFPTCSSAHRRDSNEHSSDSLNSPTLLAL
ncbi:hypothetical protein CRUP_013213 [Coryphaenoides rupestris]|nr:hypothetical protein CRUP_013213 [Coryphaenoides rupestris]